MRLINSTHVAPHVKRSSAASSLISLCAKRSCLSKKQEFVTRILKDGQHPFYRSNKGNVIDIDVAIGAMKDLIKQRSSFKRVDYLEYAKDSLEILLQVKEDCIKYGDKIPNTSDVWEMPEVVIVPKKKLNNNMLKEKKQRQRKFIQKWNKIMI